MVFMESVQLKTTPENTEKTNKSHSWLRDSIGEWQGGGRKLFAFGFPSRIYCIGDFSKFFLRKFKFRIREQHV